MHRSNNSSLYCGLETKGSSNGNSEGENVNVSDTSATQVLRTWTNYFTRVYHAFMRLTNIAQVFMLVYHHPNPVAFGRHMLSYLVPPKCPGREQKTYGIRIFTIQRHGS
jgi:hypothetical protein